MVKATPQWPEHPKNLAHEFYVDLYTPFQWSGTPASSQMVFCEIFCIRRYIPDASMEKEVLHIHLLLCHLVHPDYLVYVAKALIYPGSPLTFFAKRPSELLEWLSPRLQSSLYLLNKTKFSDFLKKCFHITF